MKENSVIPGNGVYLDLDTGVVGPSGETSNLLEQCVKYGSDVHGCVGDSVHGMMVREKVFLGWMDVVAESVPWMDGVEENDKMHDVGNRLDVVGDKDSRVNDVGEKDSRVDDV